MPSRTRGTPASPSSDHVKEHEAMKFSIADQPGLLQQPTEFLGPVGLPAGGPGLHKLGFYICHRPVGPGFWVALFTLHGARLGLSERLYNFIVARWAY